ncbi:MAG: hypothetical protein KGJ80_00380 [Chloroflexota bacterium]|nr:hypothetical protein [Chloroflexota bacterium]
MLATKLKGQITRDRRLVVRIPREMATGTVEVILLHLSPQPAKRRARRGTGHPAFGIWAKRSDITDAASFAAQLRQRVEMRADGNDGD